MRRFVVLAVVALAFAAGFACAPDQDAANPGSINAPGGLRTSLGPGAASIHDPAFALSKTGYQNIRALRGWAKSKGWVRQAGDGPEVWSVVDDAGDFSWRLKIKTLPGTRPGLAPGSQVPRFDARLAPGEYVNPFTGQRGGRGVGTHIPLEEQWIP